MAVARTVTKRDLPPSDNPGLGRWFDRTRWKFGDAEWFAAGETCLRTGNLTEAHQILTGGVEDEIARLDAAQIRKARELSALRTKIAQPPLSAEAKPKPPEAAVAPNTSPPKPPAPRPPAEPSRAKPTEEEPAFTRRELIVAFTIDLVTTLRGWMWITVASGAAVAGLITGHSDWVGIAVIDLILTGALLLYPEFLWFLGLAQVIGAIRSFVSEEPLNYEFVNFLVVCALLLIAWLGFRLTAALIPRLLGVVAVLAGTVLVCGLLIPLFGPLALPLAAVSVGGIIGAMLAGQAVVLVCGGGFMGVVAILGTLFDAPARGNSLTKRVGRLARERRRMSQAAT